MYLKLAERFNLLDYSYAHRGLWSPDGPPENSRAAYRLAAEAGLALEMDVRPSADGVPVCFHDPELDRMSDAAGLVSARSADDLQTCKLPNGETIPLLSELLANWPLNLPILIELKIDGDTDPVQFSKTVAEQVTAYAGKAAMISFNEATVAAVPAQIMRGQLIRPIIKSDRDQFDAAIQRALSSQADFLAVNIEDVDALPALNKPAICWTVKTPRHREAAQRLGFAEIFEHLPIPLAAH